MESNRQVAMHMNYKDEPRKLLPAAEPLKFRRRPQSLTRNKPLWVRQWTGGVCVGDMSGSDARENGESCSDE
jgi:hypothetical protein